MTLRAGRRVRDEVENEVEVEFEVGDEVEAQEIYLQGGKCEEIYYAVPGLTAWTTGLSLPSP